MGVVISRMMDDSALIPMAHGRNDLARMKMMCVMYVTPM